jgi:hypothetical protein
LSEFATLDDIQKEVDDYKNSVRFHIQSAKDHIRDLAGDAFENLCKILDKSERKVLLTMDHLKLTLMSKPNTKAGLKLQFMKWKQELKDDFDQIGQDQRIDKFLSKFLAWGGQPGLQDYSWITVFL